MSLLWSLQPPSGPASWLFGTMHVRDNRVYQLCHHLYPLILQSDAYIGEMHLESPPKDHGHPQYNMKEAFQPRIYEKMRSQVLKSFQLDVDRFAHLHPLMIMSAISNRVLQSDHAISLDEHLWAFARNHQLPVSGLESAEEQMSLLYSIPPEPVYVQLRQISRRPEQVRRFTDKVLKLYLSEDIHTLYRQTKSSLFRLRKPVLYHRNELMAKRILALEADLRYFITVGAGHLSGPAGLISLLRRQGWKVLPVRWNENVPG